MAGLEDRQEHCLQQSTEEGFPWEEKKIKSKIRSQGESGTHNLPCPHVIKSDVKTVKTGSHCDYVGPRTLSWVI